VREGKTDEEIGVLAGEMYGQPPASKQAVAYWRKKYRIKSNRQRAENLDHSWVRPWRVRMEHTGDGIEHRLYDFSRRRQGRELSARDEKLLDDFLAFLKKHNWVVDYNPDTPDGWLFRVRDPKIDDPDNIIRSPR
jgi:hypothetical protein